MPAPTVATYSAAALVAAQTSFRNLIDAGASAGAMKIRNAADALLATATLADPCGTVNGTTGRLTFSIEGSVITPSTAGTAAYAEFCDSDGVVHLVVPCVLGSAAVSGRVVLNTLTLFAGQPLTLISARIG